MLTWLIANKKILSYIGGAITLLVSAYQLHGYIYDSGYDAAIVEITAEHNKALEQARKDYEKEIEKSLSRLEQDHKDELTRVRNEREIITKVETVTEYVDRKIIVEAQCDKLASDVVSVLKQATNIVSTSTEKD